MKFCNISEARFFLTSDKAQQCAFSVKKFSLPPVVPQFCSSADAEEEISGLFTACKIILEWILLLPDGIEVCGLE